MLNNKSMSILLLDDGGGAWHEAPALAASALPLARLRHAAGLPAALSILTGEKIDVILLGESIGPQCIGLLHARGRGIPIIVLGKSAAADAPAAFLERGAADYLPHGQFDGALLGRAIHYAVQRAADLRKMEEALAEERSLLRAVIDSLPDHIYVKDLHHRFVLSNVAVQQFFGMTGEDLIGKTDAEFFPADTASSFAAEEEQVMRRGQSTINRENHMVSAGGQQQWTLTTKVPLRDKADHVIGLVGINHDITQRRMAMQQLEQTNGMLARRERELVAALEDLRCSHETLRATQLQLLQVEKMESVGRLAAGIAHEVKNPLAIIATGLDFLSQSNAASEPSIARALGSMGRAVRRADSVVRGLLDFSAPAALMTEPGDLNSVIRQALLLIDHELVRCQIALQADLVDGLPLVSMDANKVEQVFLNLFINAIHAMPSGGSITIRTRCERLAALGHNIGDNRTERFRAGDRVVVAEVDDTGHGIPDDKLPKIFDPFFTTKPTGKGTGLGLSVAKTIIDLHGGFLQLSNRPEGGVRASLVLKATGDATHDNNESLQDPGADRGRRGGLHPHDGHGAAADRPV